MLANLLIPECVLARLPIFLAMATALLALQSQILLLIDDVLDRVAVIAQPSSSLQ